MKKTLVTILTVALMLLMVLPASAEITDPSEARVAIVIYPSSNTTIQVMMSGFLQTAEELGMKTLYIGGDTADNATVEQMIDTAIAQYDDLYAVCLNPASEAKWLMAKKFTDNGIYVVGSWSILSDESFETYGINKDYFLGFHGLDSGEYGYNAGMLMGEKVGGKGTVAITQSGFTDNENKASEGFRKAIAENYPDMVVLDTQVESTDVTQGIGVVTSIIQANIGDLVGAFGTTGTSPQTWSQAAEDLGWDGYIIGMDATSTNLDILEAGGVDAIVAQPMYDCYAACAQHIYDHIKGEDVPFANVQSVPIIFAEDAPAYRDILRGADTYVAHMNLG